MQFNIHNSESDADSHFGYGIIIDQTIFHQFSNYSLYNLRYRNIRYDIDYICYHTVY